MSGLFSKNNLLLCGMQSNNGISAKMLKNFQNHQYTLWFLLLQAPNLQYEVSIMRKTKDLQFEFII